MISVFVSNKLVSTDTILPLLFELAGRGNSGPIRLYTSHRLTYDTIRRNRVLYDGIMEIGELKFIGATSRSILPRLAARIAFAGRVLGFAMLALCDRLTIIHFGVLNKLPFRILYMINPRRTFYFQQVAVGHSQNEARIDNLVTIRQRPAGRLAAHAVVAFQDNWEPPVAGRPAIRLTHKPTQALQHWISFVRRRSPEYFAEDFAAAGLSESNEVLVFMLGYLGSLPFLRQEDSMVDLLHETIAGLLEVGEGRPILLKPHVITDEALLRRELRRYEGKPVAITYLHPAVLAQRARLFIASYYSTTLYTGRLLGVPTIEYSDYTEAALAATGGGSMRPEAVNYFVNRDQQVLRQAIAGCLEQPVRQVATESADTGLLDYLAGTALPVTNRA